MADLPTRTHDALRALHERGRVASPWLLGMGVQPVLDGGTIQDVTGTVVALSHGMPIAWWPDLLDTREHHHEHLRLVLDPATLGCLLALVREASEEPHAYAWPSKHGPWTVYAASGHHPRVLGPECATEAEALVATLEALLGR